jgi:hypothetical protein
MVTTGSSASVRATMAGHFELIMSYSFVLKKHPVYSALLLCQDRIQRPRTKAHFASSNKMYSSLSQLSTEVNGRVLVAIFHGNSHR